MSDPSELAKPVEARRTDDGNVLVEIGPTSASRLVLGTGTRLPGTRFNSRFPGTREIPGYTGNKA